MMLTRRTLSNLAASLVASLGFLVCLTSCAKSRPPEVVVYTALDRLFSEPILKEFERQTGIRVLARYDTESTKTIGLVNVIRAERSRPRCDVFWNNEIVNTLRLKREGLLAPCDVSIATNFPVAFRDSDCYWIGFAARARVLLVNTNLVPPGRLPRSIYDLAAPEWKDHTAIAKPLFGTTATHAACLFAALGAEPARRFFEQIKSNGVRIAAGNRAVATDVAAGRVAFGLTDTDDALSEQENGAPVTIVYPDAKPGELGVLFIPNTLALVKGAPHPEAGRQLIQYLLSPAVEEALARCPSAQIPINPAAKGTSRVRTPSEVAGMAVDFSKAADVFDRAADALVALFAGT